MKQYILTLALSSLLLGSTACSEETEPVLTTKDWDNTITFFGSSDEQSADTYYKPALGYVGDPMPFFDPVTKTFKITYLQDYRPNPICYHPIYGVETTDGSSYTSLGELVPCGSQVEQDAAIGTGCVVYNEADKTYYQFYTGNKYKPTSSDNAQVVMLATSQDFKTWKKDRTFYLKGDDYGYDANDFRDPCIFKDDAGLFHMVISTLKSGKGTLAEFTSTDLKNWESAGDFMNMQWDRFYECPDVFKMGDWWYLVYSDKTSFMRMVQYFKASTLEGLKSCTAGDAGLWPDWREGKLDGRAFYAGKTASDGTNRYIWGWSPTRSGNDNANLGEEEPEWGGNLVMQRLIQHEDGTLTLGVPAAVDAKYSTEASVRLMSTIGNVSQSGGEYSLEEGATALFSRLKRHNKITFDVTATSTSRFAIEFARGVDSESWYSIHVNGDENKANFEKDGEDAQYLLDCLFSAPEDGVYHVAIYTDQSICTCYINDQLSFTNRIYQIQKNPWAIRAIQGSLKVSNIKVYNY